jgi:hypothetical protein
MQQKVKQSANNNGREFTILKVVDNIALEGQHPAEVGRGLTVQKTVSLTTDKERI